MQARLVEIAIREFGSKGIDGVSTREIAAAAGTAMSSITYHHGGKQGLYLAAADHIAARMGEEMTPAIEAEAAVRTDDPVEARAAIHRLLGRLLDKMASEDTADWAMFIMREQLNPGEAFDRLWNGVMGRLSHRLADLVRGVTGAPEPAARLATVTLMGQVMAVRACRAAMLRLIGAADLDHAVLIRIKSRIEANTDAALDRMIAEEQQ